MATRKKTWSERRRRRKSGRPPGHAFKSRASRAFSKGHAWPARQIGRLAQAYRSTAYRLASDGAEGAALTIFAGVPVPALDGLLRHLGARRYAVLTACNPGSRQLAAAENATRQARLAARLTALNLAFFPACNGPEAAEWPPEPSFCVLDAPLAVLRRLGRAFGQNALVAGRRGARPRLVWLLA